MSGAKETPRQKMIGMMYLVYTALLAMNVSAEILDAFALVSDGQQQTNASIEAKINDQYNIFQDQYNKEPEKTQLYWDQALEIRNKTDEIVNYIEKDIKLPLVLYSESTTEEALLNPKKPEESILKNKAKADSKNRRIYYDIEVANLDSKDNTEAPINLFQNQGKATELKQKIQEYREFIVNTMDPDGTRGYSSRVGLLTDVDHNGEEIHYKNANGESVDWENKYFNHLVVAAEMAILNQMVGEIQTTEYDAVSALMNRIGATDYKFNKLEARVVAKSDYIITGQDYEAEVFLVAVDTMRSFDARYSINSGSATTVKSEGGIINLKFPGKAIGEQKFSGVIEMVSPETGEIEEYPFGSTYMVAQASATIAPTKMMVMYEGLENPISVSAPGYTPKDISINVTGGSIVSSDKSKGEYMIKPNKAGQDVHVIASAIKDGKPINLRDEKFRVKPLPKPEATIGGISDGKLTKGKMYSAGKVVAEMKDFDFGGYSFEIISYDLYVVQNKERKTIGTIKGAEFNGEANRYISNATKGQEFNFNNIMAKGPNGETRQLAPIRIVIE